MTRTDAANGSGRAGPRHPRTQQRAPGRAGRGGRHNGGNGGGGRGGGGRKQSREAARRKAAKNITAADDGCWIWSHDHEKSWGDILRERNLLTRDAEPFTTATGAEGALDETIAHTKANSENEDVGKTLEEWTEVFQNAYDNKLQPDQNINLVELMIRLVATPNIFPNMWDAGRIRATHETSAWIAARIVLMRSKGIEFEDEEETTTSPNPKKKKKQRKPKRKVVAFPRKSARQAELPSVNDVLSDFNKTFFDVRLPMARESNDPLINQVIASLNEVRAFIFRADSKAQIVAWRRSKDMKPWTASDVPWTSRETIKQFVESLYARTGFNTYTRIWVAHKADAEVFEDDGTLRSSAIAFSKSDIQEHNIVTAGWLFGSHSTTNNNDLAEAINETEIVKGKFAVQLRMKEIQLVSKRNRPKDTSDFRNRPRATHVMSGQSKTHMCRVAMKELFNNRSDTIRILGKQMRFMPDALDNRFEHPPSELANLSKMAAHQREFEKVMKVQGVHSILQLDVEIPIWRLTLREVVMNLRSFEDPDYSLFVSVDTDRSDWTQTHFVFHPKRRVEAHELISKLPFFCFKKLDHRCQGWFTPHAWAQNEHYDVDWESGLVLSREEQEMGQMVQAGPRFLNLDEHEAMGMTPAEMGWEGYVDEQGNMKPVPLLQFEVELTANPKSQNGDNYTVGTFATASPAQQASHVAHAIASAASSKADNPGTFASDPRAKADYDVDHPETIMESLADEEDEEDEDSSSSKGMDTKDSPVDESIDNMDTSSEKSDSGDGATVQA